LELTICQTIDLILAILNNRQCNVTLIFAPSPPLPLVLIQCLSEACSSASSGAIFLALKTLNRDSEQQRFRESAKNAGSLSTVLPITLAATFAQAQSLPKAVQTAP
jgi:hypothetical protein